MVVGSGYSAAYEEALVVLPEPVLPAVPFGAVDSLAAAVVGWPSAVAVLQAELSLALASRHHLEACSALALVGSSAPPLLV